MIYFYIIVHGSIAGSSLIVHALRQSCSDNKYSVTLDLSLVNVYRVYVLFGLPVFTDE